MTSKKYIEKIKKLFRVSYAMAIFRLKGKNEDTLLGMLWYFLSPMLTFLLLLFIFYDRTGKNIPNYPFYLLLGVVIFNFFQRIMNDGVIAVRSSAAIIKSMSFPKEALVLSLVIQSLISHFFEAIVFLLIIFFFGWQTINLFFYPLILIFLCIFCYGVALIFAALCVYFFDFINIWSFASSLIWLGTPIFYAIGGQDRLFVVNLLNPLFYFITAAREILIYSQVPDLYIILGVIFYSFAALFLGLFIFKKLKDNFAEVV